MAIDKPIMFIHVPKTGGTSLRSLIKDNFSWTPWFKIPDVLAAVRPEQVFAITTAPRHEPVSLLETKNDLSNFFVFGIVRSPYTRAYSLYKHLARFRGSIAPQGLTRIVFTNFVDFLTHVKANVDVYDEKHFMRPRPYFEDYVTYTQTFFLTNSEGVITADKIYRFENLAELEADFELSLPNENKGGYTSEDYYEDYTPEAIELVKEIYAKDFENFNYSLDFE